MTGKRRNSRNEAQKNTGSIFISAAGHVFYGMCGGKNTEEGFCGKYNKGRTVLLRSRWKENIHRTGSR